MKKNFASLGVLLALALVLSYVESFIPFPVGIPGLKLGLANIVTVILLFRYGKKEAFLITAARVFLAGFLFGNFFSIFYSLAGALLSLAVMILMKKTGKFKVVSVSAAGGVFHNIGQLAIAVFLVGTTQIFYYLPILLIAGLITGVAVGLISQEILIRTRHISNH